MKIAISGAQGFAGRHLAEMAVERGHGVECLSRSEVAAPIDGARYVNVSNGCGGADYSRWTDGADVFVHLAGRAHIMRETSNDPAAAFHAANVESTVMAARQARSQGVRKFIFVSSIGVHGNVSSEPVRADSPFAPRGFYAASKLAAENALRSLRVAGQFEVAFIRPPLMYGPNVTANFLRLIRLVDTGTPLPFAAINNRKSFLGVRNFADFALHVASAPQSDGKAFVPADRECVSTPELVRTLSRLLGRKPRLFPVSRRLLRVGSHLFGKQALYNQLCDSLSVDTDYLYQASGWTPPLSQEMALRQTVDWYVTQRR